MTTVTLDLPKELYQRAKQVATSTQQPLEHVVLRWIQPFEETPSISNIQESETRVLQEMDRFNTEELTQIAKSRIPTKDTQRLCELFDIQRTQGLTASEEHELNQLVKQGDKLTLQKARALVLLKQRGLLPGGLHSIQKFLSE